jgi:hypothetical protein
LVREALRLRGRNGVRYHGTNPGTHTLFDPNLHNIHDHPDPATGARLVNASGVVDPELFT